AEVKRCRQRTQTELTSRATTSPSHRTSTRQRPTGAVHLASRGTPLPPRVPLPRLVRFPQLRPRPPPAAQIPRPPLAPPHPPPPPPPPGPARRRRPGHRGRPRPCLAYGGRGRGGTERRPGRANRRGAESRSERAA